MHFGYEGDELNLAVILLILIPSFAFADASTDRDMEAFLGGGLTYGQDSLSLGPNAATAKYQDQGFVIEAGFSQPVGSRFGLQVSGEVGNSNSINTITSQSYMETGTLSYYSGKGGVYWGPFGLGAGYRHNDINIKSLSTPTPGYLESNYSGTTSLEFANITLDFRKRYRGVIETQYNSGTLQGSGASTGSSVKFNEMAVSLRVFADFD
jgi:hypothetical protein